MECSNKSTYELELETHGKIIYTNKGVSMMPLLRQDRDLMVINKVGSERLKKYDAVLYKRDNGQYVLHRILKVRDKDYWIVGDNCYIGEYIRYDQIMGILAAVKRDGKVINVTDKKYLMYVHLWCDVYPVRFLLLRIKHFCGRVVRFLRKRIFKGKTNGK